MTEATETLVVTTWNLQGREQPAIEEVAAVIERLGADVVLAQEVQRRQARRLAARLGYTHTWTWKHWPVVHPAEGLAVLSRRPLHQVRSWTLAAPWRFWSWRRRVAILARIDGVRVCNIHLGSGVSTRERRRQAADVVAHAMAGRSACIVGGDCNARPGSPVIDDLVAAGLIDADQSPDDHRGTTNWRGERIQAPDQVLDFVFVGGAVRVLDARVADGPDSDWPAFGALSDHVPVTARLRLGERQTPRRAGAGDQ